jgi:hypothetical protein
MLLTLIKRMGVTEENSNDDFSTCKIIARWGLRTNLNVNSAIHALLIESCSAVVRTSYLTNSVALEPEGSSLYSQESATGSYLEPA